MPDIVSKKARSRMMSGIRATNTRPELVLRSGLHGRGFRYRLHCKGLPGKPDLVFPSYRAVIFVNGCFWHGHDCHLFKWPKSREKFWKDKITGNMRRDCETIRKLQEQGWRTGRIWECALKGKTRKPLEDVLDQCAAWLKGNERNVDIRGQ